MTFTLRSRLGRLRLALASWSVAAALLAVAPCLHAQETTPSVAAQRKEDAPVGAVRVVVHTDENDLLLTVAQPERETGIVRCYHQCSFWGLPGRYTLWATSPEREVLYETALRVGERTAFKVSSGHPDVRSAGLIVGIVGPIAMVGGLILWVDQLASAPHCDPYPCREAPPTDLVPPAMLIGWLVATLGGWIIFGAMAPSVTPVDEKAFKPTQSARPPRLQLGLLPLPHSGWALGLSTQF